MSRADNTTTITYERAQERMAGVNTLTLCQFVLTAVWKDPCNATGVNGEAMHAHAIESLVYRVREKKL